MDDFGYALQRMEDALENLRRNRDEEALEEVAGGLADAYDALYTEYYAQTRWTFSIGSNGRVFHRATESWPTIAEALQEGEATQSALGLYLYPVIIETVKD